MTKTLPLLRQKVVSFLLHRFGKISNSSSQVQLTKEVKVVF